MANLLYKEDSPYLQQHKDNPVDWMPWCDEAFQKAKDEKKPIFLSIGYSSCHWCHVMEHEVFEDETLAAFLNAHFVSIKVDKEERPDIDKHYQELYMMLNRRAGGWPLSIFLTPENKAFYAATYIPPTRKNNQMGFDELTQIIAEKIASSDKDLLKNAQEIEHFMKKDQTPTEGTKLDKSILATFVRQASNSFETNYGGFSVSPKFPHTTTLHTLLDIYLLNHDEHLLDMVTKTLDGMQIGGLYDLIDGGFCRYSTDEAWLVPHFEKMTYDNALLIELYQRAFELTKNRHYKETALETLAFMQEKMQKNDLFYSASDADTNAHEGLYFVYDYEKTRAALSERFSDTQTEEILNYFSISSEGNFEGHTILRAAVQDRPAWYEEAKAPLRDLRDPELYPFIDQKVIVAWNAMMIKSLFKASRLDTKFLTQAQNSLKALLDKLYLDNQLYHTALIEGTPKVTAFLEDYAFLADALITAYQVTMDETHLILAQKLANDAIALYYKEGVWNFSKGDFTTRADATDNTYAGSISVMVDLLLALGRLVDSKYETIAFKTFEYHSYKLMRTPLHYPKLCSAVLRFLHSEYIFKLPLDRLDHTEFEALKTEYPFILWKAHQEKEILVCDQQSCYNNVATAQEAVNAFKNLIKG